MISVIIPILNPIESFLNDAINSILSQTKQNFEIIIVEDPGTSSAKDLVNTISDKRIKFIQNSYKEGFAAQLNKGIRIAKGDFIARFDGDDISNLTRLAKQSTFLKRNPSMDIVGSNIRLINNDNSVIGARKYPEESQNIIEAIRQYCPIAHPSVMGKKDFFKNNLYNGNYGITSDYELWARAAKSGVKFHNLQDFLLDYRLHDNSSKKVSLKKTLKNTIKIKKQYFFDSKKSWGIKENFRFILEKILIGIPDIIVYKAFTWYILNNERL